MSEVRTPKELADAVRAAIPNDNREVMGREAFNKSVAAFSAVGDLESRASRVARLEEKVAKPVVEFKTNPVKLAIDPGCVPAGRWHYEPRTNPVRNFERALVNLCAEHKAHVTIGTITIGTPLRGFAMLPREGLQEPLPPAESCAHAVERFRQALLLLTKRHEVEVEIGHIEAGSRGGGIEQLPDQNEEAAEIDAAYRKEFDEPVRERKAWDAIEAWIDRAPVVARRGTEFRKTLRPRCGQPDMHILIVNEHSSDKFVCGGVRSSQHQSKPFHALKRLVALEAAAAWCEGQK